MATKMKLHVEIVPLDSLKPHPQNPRQGDIGAIVESLSEHGQYKPLVVQRGTRHILAGNHTWQGAAQLEWTHIQVVFVDVDDEQALKILLVDNRTSDLATYDDALLADLLKAVHAVNGELTGTGFDTDALDDLLAKVDGGTNFEGSGDGDTEMPYERMGFTLTPAQAKKVRKALDTVRDADEASDDEDAKALVSICALAMKHWGK